MPHPARRVAIVDDEPIARLGLRRMIERLPATVIVGEARSGPEATRLLREHPVDILFLDIQMPGSTGLDVLARLSVERRPVVVFVTAFDEYAVNAFDLDVADFLLKPFDAARFARAWDRACTALDTREPHTTRTAGVKTTRTPPRAQPLLFRVDGRVMVVAPREVLWVEAMHNVVQVHTMRGVFQARQSLQALAGRLGSLGFVRVHRSVLVNAVAVVAMRVTRSGDGTLDLRGGASVPISRRYRLTLERLLRV